MKTILNELSKKVLGNYIKKASDRNTQDSYKTGIYVGTSGKEAAKSSRVTKREKGIHKAVGKLTEEKVVPVIYDDVADINRCNDMLDAISAKQFINPEIAVTAFRAALDFHGVTLPRLEIERDIPAPDATVAKTILSTGQHPVLPLPECEYVFKIGDVDAIDGSEDDDWDDDLYLYICIDQDVESPYFNAYAQVVDGEHLDTLLNMDIPEIEKEFPQFFGDPSGETDYEKQVRYTDMQTGFVERG